MLFHFELHPIEQIEPWGDPPKQTLSWFALTDGLFHIDTGSGTLCRYVSKLADEDTGSCDVDYQIAAIAGDVLASFPAAIAPLPTWARVLAEDWPALADLRKQDHEDHYEAFRWIGERSPWLSYFLATPRFSFFNLGDEIAIHWDNRDLEIDGEIAWEAPLLGSARLPFDEFVAECHGFAERLLEAMTRRVDGIEAGAKAKIELDANDLRRQQVKWEDRLRGYLTAKYEPDIEWDKAAEAIEKLRGR